MKHILEVWEGKEPPPADWQVPNAGRLLALLFKEELLQRLRPNPEAMACRVHLDKPRKRKKKKSRGPP